MRLVIGIALCLVWASSSLGQIDAATLRMKYGAPLNGETFKVRPNIEMVVNYGPNGQVCRIELPPGENTVGQPPPDIATTQQVDEVLNEVIPASIRGKDTGRHILVSGMNSVSQMTTEFEHLLISAAYHGDTRPTLSITFKDEACRAELAIQ